MNVSVIWNWSKRGLIVGSLLVLLLLVMEFNTRMTRLHRLEAQQALESTDIYQLRLTESYLQTEIAYATSEPAVEEWAREYGFMRETEDHVILLQENEDFTPMPEMATIATPEALSNWDVWILWFFGETP